MQTLGKKEREIKMHKLIYIEHINMLYMLVSTIRKQRKIKMLAYRVRMGWKK